MAATRASPVTQPSRYPISYLTTQGLFGILKSFDSHRRPALDSCKIESLSANDSGPPATGVNVGSGLLLSSTWAHGYTPRTRFAGRRGVHSALFVCSFTWLSIMSQLLSFCHFVISFFSCFMASSSSSCPQ